METYLDQERMKYDYENVLEYAVEQGEARGEARGRFEGKRETAKNMLAEKLPFEVISRVTGLSVEEVRSL